MAIAVKIQNAKYGDAIVEHNTYVIASDVDLMEGISHEAASIAGHYQLEKLIALFDDNGISIDGPTSLTVSDDQLARFKASNWHAINCDGHDEDSIELSIKKALKDPSPSIIAFKTKIIKVRKLTP